MSANKANGNLTTGKTETEINANLTTNKANGNVTKAIPNVTASKKEENILRYNKRKENTSNHKKESTLGRDIPNDDKHSHENDNLGNFMRMLQEETQN